MLTLARVKVPAVAWTVVPAVFFALGLAVADAFRRPALAGALIGALSVPSVVAHWPALARLKIHLPAAFPETRTRAGLLEGLVVVAICLASGALVQMARPLFPRIAGAGAWLFSLTALALVLLLVVVDLPKAQAKAVRDSELQSLMGYEKESGLALDREDSQEERGLPGLRARTALGVRRAGHDFWSGRMSYRHAPDPATAHREGYHPYLVSPGAQPFREVPGVPASSWLRAYDSGRSGAAASAPGRRDAGWALGRRHAGAGLCSDRRRRTARPLRVLRALRGPAGPRQRRVPYGQGRRAGRD